MKNIDEKTLKELVAKNDYVALDAGLKEIYTTFNQDNVSERELNDLLIMAVTKNNQTARTEDNIKTILTILDYGALSDSKNVTGGKSSAEIAGEQNEPALQTKMLEHSTARRRNWDAKTNIYGAIAASTLLGEVVAGFIFMVKYGQRNSDPMTAKDWGIVAGVVLGGIVLAGLLVYGGFKVSDKLLKPTKDLSQPELQKLGVGNQIEME